MQYSKQGLALTEQFEGCRLTAYLDQVGVPTIGPREILLRNSEYPFIKRTLLLFRQLSRNAQAMLQY